MTIEEQVRQHLEWERLGQRPYSACSDCGGERFQYFNRASDSWTHPRHSPGENCITLLRKRIEALEQAKEQG